MVSGKCIAALYALKTDQAVQFSTKQFKYLLMKQDATEQQNRLLHFPLIKHQASTTFTANRFLNALAENGFRLKSNQSQFTKGKGKAELFTQSAKRLDTRNTKTYKLLAKMYMSYSTCGNRIVYKQTSVPRCGLKRG